jgi:hypothetical protein
MGPKLRNEASFAYLVRRFRPLTAGSPPHLSQEEIPGSEAIQTTNRFEPFLI